MILQGLVFLISASAIAAPQPETKTKALVQIIKSEDVQKKVLLPARVEPMVSSTVTSDLDGLIKKINKSLGSTVKAGEVIMYVENKDPAFTFSAVPLRAPVSGVITFLNNNLMSRVSKGEKLFTITDGKNLKILAEVPTHEIGNLGIGKEGTFKSHFNPAAKTFKVIVTGMSPIMDPRTGTSTVEVKFVLSQDALPAVGSVGQLSFTSSAGKSIFIPESAILYVDGKPTVRVLSNENKSTRRVVEIGEQQDNAFRIISGLKEGERIVVRASKSIKENEEVEVEQPKEDKK